MNPTVKELAAEVLAMLKGQQTYFRDRSSANLVASKAAERAMREKCETILKPPEQKLLFEQTKKFRVVSGTHAIHGAEFEVPAGATEQEIAEAAWDVCAERISYGWEEVR